jgi:hypothetical protein
MGRPAARVGDPTTHGIPLGPGPKSADVLIGGRPTWRLGDLHSCPWRQDRRPMAADTSSRAARPCSSTAELRRARETRSRRQAGSAGSRVVSQPSGSVDAAPVASRRGSFFRRPDGVDGPVPGIMAPPAAWRPRAPREGRCRANELREPGISSPTRAAPTICAQRRGAARSRTTGRPPPSWRGSRRSASR